MRALRASLEDVDGTLRRDTLARLGREYGVRIIPARERPTIGIAPIGAALQGLQDRLREELGNGTEVRIAPRARELFVRLQAGDDGYWIGFPLPPRPAQEFPSRALAWVAAIIVLLLLAAFAFARYLARPLGRARSGGRARRPRRDPGRASRVRHVGDRRGKPRVQHDAREPAPDRARPCDPARRHLARSAHAARAPAPRHRTGEARRGRARGHDLRHRGDGPDHRPVPRFRAGRSRGRDRSGGRHRRACRERRTLPAFRERRSADAGAVRWRCASSRPRCPGWRAI